jgi:hypothetical protein
METQSSSSSTDLSQISAILESITNILERQLRPNALYRQPVRGPLALTEIERRIRHLDRETELDYILKTDADSCAAEAY